MTTSDAFVQEFELLLGKIPQNISLQQLQYDYRQVAVLMGTKLLQKFPEILVGPQPSPQPEGDPIVGFAPAGGPVIGPHPHQICAFVCIMLGSS